MNTPKYIDIHSHLNLEQFDADREEVIAKMKEQGVWTITVGVDYKTSESAVELAERHEYLFACVGLHPNDAPDEVFNYEAMLELAKHKKVVAIGECGFDYYRGADEKEKARQKGIFELQIKLAIEVGKPLMLHARPSKGSMDAYNDALDLIEMHQRENPNLRANFHFFVGDMTVAKRALSLGLTMSYDGPITFSRDYDEVIRMLPLESIMAETDAPFAAPLPYRGQRNEPSYVSEVVKKIAEIKDLPLEKVEEALVINAKRAFDI